MKKILPFILLYGAIYFTACQREISLPESSKGAGDSLTANLLVRSVSLWSDGTTPAADSIVTEYTYNDSGRLIKKEVTGQHPIHYRRDAQQRVTGITNVLPGGDTAYTKVFYVSDSSMQVAYLLHGLFSSATPLDSMAYTYTGGRVSSIYMYTYNSGMAVFGGYQQWTFDAQGNAIQLKQYASDSTLNMSYTFEYDNKVNPMYAADDARLPAEWGYTSSPNNIVKQNNEYSGGMPGDYVTYTYVYGSNNVPLTGKHAGPAIGSNVEALRFYYQ